MARKLTISLMLLWTSIVMIFSGLMMMSRGTAVAAQAPMVDGAQWAEQVIRLHVVANSDTEADQALKREIRDAILAEVTPLFVNVRTQAEARAIIERAIPQIEQVAVRVVAARGQVYPVRAEVGRYAFPGKAYGRVFLPAGEYNALRVLVGDAAGANWWCILFPPMCFTDWSAGVVLEPKPGSGGSETVTVPRPALVDEAELAEVPVRPRSAVLQWLRARFRPDEEAEPPATQAPQPRVLSKLERFLTAW